MHLCITPVLASDIIQTLKVRSRSENAPSLRALTPVTPRNARQRVLHIHGQPITVS